MNSTNAIWATGASDGRAALRLTLGFVAGMVAAFVGLALMAARLSMFFGTLGLSWTAFGGAVIVAASVLLFTRNDAGALCPTSVDLR